MRALVHILCSAVFFIAGVMSISDANAAPTPEQIDKIFDQWDRTNTPGCALAVIQDGEIVYTRGYGMANLEHGVPISSESVFYVCSVSKQFTAMCIALLAEQGKLSLDDNIRKFLPEIPEYGRPITIRNLIYHTSGIRDYFILWELAGRDYTDSMLEEEVFDILSRQKGLNFTPGEQYSYSNSGYFLLSVIIKRISGKSLREFAEENIFKPLGMRHTHFHDDNTFIVKNLANGHIPRQDGNWGLLTFRFALVGSGGLHTSVEDMYLWDQNFYHNRLGKGGQGLIDLTLTRGNLNDGKALNYAFGLEIGEYRGLKTVRHSGSLGGYRSHLLRFPGERFSVIILCNLSSINPGALVEKLADLYLADHLAPAETLQKSSVRSRDTTGTTQKTGTTILSPEQLAEYAGEYYSDELQTTYRFFIEDSTLCFRIRSNPKKRLDTMGKDTFSGIMFERDTNGRISGFKLDSGIIKNIEFVKKI